MTEQIAQAWEPPSGFDGFLITRLIGAGGMGRVYLAHEPVLERDVAVKFIAAERPEHAALERFLIEARAVARLHHPNVVSVYRVGEVDGRPYVACEFVPGKSLDQMALPVGWRDALRIGIGLTRGLAAAQGRGILHRDIKPANIMLSDAGEVKLVDFGIAKLVDDGVAGVIEYGAPISIPSTQLTTVTDFGRAPDEQPAFGLTRAGTVLGTPRYLAPELWRGARASLRSDVFSLGVVLYELCTGMGVRAPREDATDDWFDAPLPPLRERAPDVPLELAFVIDRCVAVRPDERFASAQDVRDALERIAATLESPMLRAASTSGRPETRFTRVGDVSIAYQVVGTGPTDLVMIPGFVSHLELSWEEPSFARFLERLATGRRLILFDKRGTGLSDRVDVSSISDRMEDVRAVMEAVGSERATLFGMSEGGVLAALMAATYPERTRALVAYGSVACSLKSPDFPEGQDAALFEWAFEQIRTRWGEPIFLEQEAPSRVGDEAFARWWARYLKMAASPSSAIALLRANSQIDVRHLMPAIRVPTLVLNREHDQLVPAACSRDLARRIPGARYQELPGLDHLPFLDDGVLLAIESFLAELPTGSDAATVLATVLVVEAHGTAGVRALLDEAALRHGGSALRSSRGGAHRLAFDGPARALRCALALAASSHGTLSMGLDVAVMQGGDDAGEAAAIAEQVAALARPGEILVTRVVKDLAGGSDLRFAERSSELTGAGIAPLYAAAPAG